LASVILVWIYKTRS